MTETRTSPRRWLSALPGDSYQSVLYRNPGTPGNHSITLSLTGTRSNRSAIGAVIHVTVPGAHAPHEIYRSVGYGSSFGGNPLRQHIGVGASGGPVTVTVHWPASNTTQVFRRIAVDRAYAITEGKDGLEPIVPPKVRLPDPKVPMTMMQEAGP